MFKKLMIHNFQSHGDTTLRFDQGVNVICGQSGSGKTAIVRALRLAIYNRPSGARYYSNFAEDGITSVDILLDSNKWVGVQKKVSRKKDGTKDLKASEYYLDEQGEEDPQSWQSGVKVPDEIFQLLNIGEINISTQFDKHFLILSSPGEVARTINRLTKLEEVDSWKSNLTKQINTNNSDIKLLKAQLVDQQAEMQKYAGFQQLRGDIDDLLKLDSRLQADVTKSRVIDGQLVRIEKIDQELKRGLDPDVLARDMETLDRLDGNLEKLISQKVKTLQLEKIDADIRALEDMLVLLLKLKEIEDNRAYCDGLNMELRRVEAYDYEIRELETKLDTTRIMYVDALKRAKVCPVCTSPLTDKLLKQVGEKL